MPHLLSYRTVPSGSVSAAMRERLGITQQELGDLLGVGRAQVGHVEAGRRAYSPRAQARLTRLSELLPARLFRPGGALAAPAGPVGPASPTPAEQADLRRRLRNCRRTLSGLTYAEQGRPRLAAALARRTQGLAALRAALAAAPGTDPARDLDWVELLDLATTLVARRQPTATALGLAALRRQLLELEITGLLRLLDE